MYLGGVIGTQHVLGDAAAVSEQAGSCLPGGAALAAIHTDDVLGVLILLCQIGIGQADVRLDIQCIIGIHILQGVIRFYQEDVDLVVIGSRFLIQQTFVQLVLIVVVVVGVDGPLDDGAVLQGGGGLIGCDFGNFRIVIVEAALELIVPAPDVQGLAACCGSLGCGCGRSGGGCCCAGGRRAAACCEGCANSHDTGSKQKITTRDLFHKGKPPSLFSIFFKKLRHRSSGPKSKAAD